MIVLQFARYLLLGLTYLGLALGQFPGLRMNRATIALVGAAFLIALGVLNLLEALTLFGSVANLIVAEAAAQLGYQLTFKEHLRFGLPLTAITLVIAYFWIY